MSTPKYSIRKQKERSQRATRITRKLLLISFDDPQSILRMMDSEIDPKDIENHVFRILRYLEETEPAKTEETKGQ